MRTETSGPHDVVPVDLAVVAAVCDTLLPALSTDADGAYGDYLRRGASERDIPESVAAAVPALPPHVAGALRGLLDELAAEGFAGASLEARTERLRRAGDDVPSGRLAVMPRSTSAIGTGTLSGISGSRSSRAIADTIIEPGKPGRPVSASSSTRPRA